MKQLKRPRAAVPLHMSNTENIIKTDTKLDRQYTSFFFKVIYDVFVLSLVNSPPDYPEGGTEPE